MQARANLISLYGRTKQWEKAEASYRAVVASGLNQDEAHYNYGVSLALQSRWTEAADAYRAAIAVNPLHAQAHNNLGQLLERDKGLDAAAHEYRARRPHSPRSGSRASTSRASFSHRGAGPTRSPSSSRCARRSTPRRRGISSR